MSTKKVWFVTGASKGLGLTLVKKLLNNGCKVAATSRSITDLTQAVGAELTNLLPLQVDLVNEESVVKAVMDTVREFGSIDVVVNNAGYGQLGTLEELTDAEARKNFDVNVFGSLNVIRSVMPYLREQKSGHIFNISSVGGFIGTFPGWGIYCATKFAVAGFTESLSAEAKSLGINATVVYPGYFRTNFLEKGSLNLPKHSISEYKEARAAEQIHLNDITGNQPGDPEKAADALIELSKQENAPVHFFMGTDSYNLANNKIEIIKNELAANEILGTSTDFEKVM